MPSNNSKYTEKFREHTVKHIFETGKYATRMAEEMGNPMIDTQLVKNALGNAIGRRGIVKRKEYAGKHE